MDAMFDLLQPIPGPLFLVYFVAGTAALIAGAWWLARDRETAAPLPEPTTFSPTALAALRGGWVAVARLVSFEMWQRGCLRVLDAGDRVESAPGDGPLTDPIERQVHSFFREPRPAAELFSDLSTRAMFREYAQQLEGDLQERELLRRSEDVTASWLGVALAAVAILVFGGAKLTLGLAHDRPVMLLVVGIAGGLIGLLAICRPWRRLTRHGEAFLAAARSELSATHDLLAAGHAPRADSNESSYAVAAFGVGALGTSVYHDFAAAFPRDTPGAGCGG